MPPDARTVLVTGATSGIGRAVVRSLVDAGATVGALARSEKALEALMAEAAGPGVVLPLAADVADPVAVEAAVERLTGGRSLDAVVHAAGVVDIGRFEDVPPDLFDAVLRTNLGGTVVVARATLPRLRRSGGPLVVLGSMLGEVPSPLMSAYVTSKHGVHGLVRSLQAELGRAGPPVVLVEPSAVRTPIYRKAGTQAGAHGAPVPPVVDPEKVAARVLAALARPRRTVRVGPLVRPSVALFRLLPGAYEALAREAATRLGLDHTAAVAPTPGAVLHPLPEADRTRGPRARRRLRDLVRPGTGPRARLAGPPRGTDRP